MSPQVDRTNPTPLYEQIRIALRDQILAGDFRPGAQLPTERALCDQYEVSRITVIKALSDLERDGLIRRVQGKGSIVKSLPIQGSLNQVRGFTQTVRQNGMEPRSKILSVETINGDAALRAKFDLPANDPRTFYRFKRLMTINDEPAILLNITVREEVGRKLIEQPLDNVSFYKTYEAVLGRRVVRNDASLQPVLATSEAVQLLGVKRGSPHFSFRGLSYLEGDIPVEYAIGIFRGDMFTFSGTMYRIREEVVQRDKPHTGFTFQTAPQESE